MTHPPIPPKSEAFYTDDSEENWLFSCPEETSDFCWGIYLKAATRYERFIIAAVAEVEWRKRAERWTVIMNALEFRPSTCTGRYNSAIKSAHWSQIYADAWRAWGEGEIKQ